MKCITCKDTYYPSYGYCCKNGTMYNKDKDFTTGTTKEEKCESISTLISNCD